MKAFDKMQDISFLCSECGHSDYFPVPLDAEYKISLPRNKFGAYQLEVFLICDERINLIAKNFPDSVKARDYLLHATEREFGHKRFDNSYIVFTIEHAQTKKRLQHYFRMIDFMHLGELVSAAYNGKINQYLSYQNKLFDKYKKHVATQCTKYKNLSAVFNPLPFGEDADDLTPEEQEVLNKLTRSKAAIEDLVEASRKKSHSPVRIYEKVSCSGEIAFPPVTTQDSFVSSSCVIGYTPNIDNSNPAWKIVICNSFMPMNNSTIGNPLTLAKLESQGLLLTTHNIYHIIKIIDAIVLRWIDDQL